MPVFDHHPDEAPEAMFSGDAIGARNIKCPVCLDDYSHITEVFTRFGYDPSEGGKAYPGTIGKSVTGFRRDALVVVFDGECGHAWELIIQQHKGINLLQIRTADSDQAVQFAGASESSRKN